MSEVEVNEHIDNEIPEQAPAEELVDLILTGELHAANQKFNSIVEGKVIDAIEEEKHKISQTLFADDEEEVDEGKIPPQFLKGKDKDDDDDDDSDDEEEDEDDSPVGKEGQKEGKIPPQFLKKGKDDDSDDDDDDDSDDDDSDSDDDDDDDGKSKKGKVPPQFMKKEEIGEMIGDREDDAFQRRNIEADKARHKEAQSKGYANDIDRRRGKKSTVQRVKNAVGSLVNKATGNKNEDVEPVDELSSDLLGRASDKANKQSQDASQGVGETGKEKDYKKQDTALAKKKGIQSRKFERGASDASDREAVAKNRAIAAQQAKNEDLSFDPGEASANVELPEDSFVQQVAAHLGGKRV